MKKMPTIFERDWEGDRSRVTDKQNPAAAWVFAGEGMATRKLDGTSCLVKDGKLFKRRELRADQDAPDGFILADTDEMTHKVVGWVPVGGGAEDRWHMEAWEYDKGLLHEGTYELIGPKVQGNPERAKQHLLIPHDKAFAYSGVPTDFEGLREWLAGRNIEGLVWHHDDGRMAKIKLRDFGLRRENAHNAHPEGTLSEPVTTDGAEGPANAPK